MTPDKTELKWQEFILQTKEVAEVHAFKGKDGPEVSPSEFMKDFQVAFEKFMQTTAEVMAGERDDKDIYALRSILMSLGHWTQEQIVSFFCGAFLANYVKHHGFVFGMSKRPVKESDMDSYIKKTAMLTTFYEGHKIQETNREIDRIMNRARVSFDLLFPEASENGALSALIDEYHIATTEKI